MLIGIANTYLGCGKTLAGVFFSYLAHTSKERVASNIVLKFSYTPILTEEVYNNFREGVMLLDELWSWSDSRVSLSVKNYIINSVPLKSRKRKLVVIWTAQQLNQIDLRIRNITDIFVIPEMAFVTDQFGQKILDKKGREVQVCLCKVWFRKSNRTKHLKFIANDYYDLYNTEEEVEEMEFTKKEEKQNPQTSIQGFF